MTQVRTEYETRMKGLLPSRVRDDLEATIEALKRQASTLEQRASLLQEQLGGDDRCGARA